MEERAPVEGRALGGARLLLHGARLGEVEGTVGLEGTGVEDD